MQNKPQSSETALTVRHSLLLVSTQLTLRMRKSTRLNDSSVGSKKGGALWPRFFYFIWTIYSVFTLCFSVVLLKCKALSKPLLNKNVNGVVTRQVLHYYAILKVDQSESFVITEYGYFFCIHVKIKYKRKIYLKNDRKYIHINIMKEKCSFTINTKDYFTKFN